MKASIFEKEWVTWYWRKILCRCKWWRLSASIPNCTKVYVDCTEYTENWYLRMCFCQRRLHKSSNIPDRIDLLYTTRIKTMMMYSSTAMYSFLKPLNVLILQHLWDGNFPVSYHLFFSIMNASFLEERCYRMTLRKNICSGYKVYYTVGCRVGKYVASITLEPINSDILR